MALQRVMPGTHPALFAVLMAVVAVLAILALTVVLGVQGPAPSYTFTPDPAGGLGLPF